jgi:hypothetical protein
MTTPNPIRLLSPHHIARVDYAASLCRCAGQVGTQRCVASTNHCDRPEPNHAAVIHMPYAVTSGHAHAHGAHNHGGSGRTMCHAWVSGCYHAHSTNAQEREITSIYSHSLEPCTLGFEPESAARKASNIEPGSAVACCSVKMRLQKITRCP